MNRASKAGPNDGAKSGAPLEMSAFDARRILGVAQVNEKTLRRWVNGKPVSRLTRRALEDTARKLQIALVKRAPREEPEAAPMAKSA